MQRKIEELNIIWGGDKALSKSVSGFILDIFSKAVVKEKCSLEVT